MSYYRFFEMAFALCFGLTFALVGWWEIAGPIWHLEWTGSDEQWLNVASATLIGGAILVGGVASLFGADGMPRREWICDEHSGRLSRAGSEDDSRSRGTDDPLSASGHVEGAPLYPDDTGVHHELDRTRRVPGRELKHAADVADE